jgi:hypothetical protein
MKAGKTLSELAQEIERRAGARKDYIVGTNALKMNTVEVRTPVAGAKSGNMPGDGDSTAVHLEPRLILTNGSPSPYPIRELAHRQIGERLGIPAKYYDRMLAEAPQLLVANANHWFEQQGEKRMVRTLDGHVRAFLSNRYQRIDNHEVAEVVLPTLMEAGRDLQIVSCEVTEKRLYIKATDKSVVAEVKGSRRVGDLVEAGMMITNSEVGLGAVQVTPFLNFLWCLNGCVINKAGMRSTHVGTRLDVDDDIAALLADDTRKVLDRGVLLKVRDTVRALLDSKAHQQRVDKMSEQTQQLITAPNPAAAIEVLANDYQLNEGEQGSVLRHLIQGGDLSRYGLMNAVTRTAEDAPDYDRATELEALGGRIFELPANDWRRIAEAA